MAFVDFVLSRFETCQCACIANGYSLLTRGTQHPTHCVDGITNIIAGIEGTDDELKHESLDMDALCGVWIAHTGRISTLNLGWVCVMALGPWKFKPFHRFQLGHLTYHSAQPPPTASSN